MDLTSLNAALGEKDERNPLEAVFPTSVDGPSVAEEIFARHSRSAQPESKQLCVILTATLEVIASQGLQPTPTALFAAVLSSVQRQDASAEAAVTAAMCNLLSLILARVPTSILRSRSVQGGQIMVNLIEGGSPRVAKAALPCLSQFIAAMNPSDWPALSRGFGIILTACLNHQPKLRKKAQSGLVDILAAFQTTPVLLSAASEAVLKLCQKILPGPEAAAHAAAAAPSKKRQQAEDAIAAAVADALHLIGALKSSIALLTGACAQPVCQLLLDLYPLRQPLLTKNVTDLVGTLFSAPGSHLSARALTDILSAVILSQESWGTDIKRDSDAESVLGMIRLLEDGIATLASRSIEEESNKGTTTHVSALVPRTVYALIPHLSSHQEGIRRTATAALCNIISQGLEHERKEEKSVEPSRYQSNDGDKKKKWASKQNNNNNNNNNTLSPMQRVIVAVESALGPQYRDAWESSLTISGHVFQKLGMQGADLCSGLIYRIGQLCAGVDDVMEAAEDEEAGEEVAKLTVAAQSTLGIALRTVGPEAVLATLPLNLIQGLDGTGEARTWLLPLLRMHVRGARLGYWLQEMLPLARAMNSRAVLAAKEASSAPSSSIKQREAQVCSTLEGQIWATLPSFCSWAEDVGYAFPSLSTAITTAFERRANLRTPICNAIRRLASQTLQALRHHGIDDSIGFIDPTASGLDDDLGGGGGGGSQRVDVEEDMDAEELFNLTIVPEEHITLEKAQSALSALRSKTDTWLPLLLSAFVTTPANQRGHIGAAISAYACASEPESVAPLFRAAIIKLMKVIEQARTGELGRDSVLEGGDSDVARVCTFMEASLLLAGGLDANGIQVLYKASISGTKEKDPAIQKKSYKILTYVCECRSDYVEPNFADVLQVLQDGSATAISAAKRYRLRCIKAIILRLVDVNSNIEVGDGAGSSDNNSETDRVALARHIITPMVTEIILCVKEANKRTRAAAFDLLVDVAHSMHAANPDPDHGGLRSLVNIILGGLVGSTPHMISASVMALARLLFEFAPNLSILVPSLLPSIIMLLRSKAREVIKSVLGFIKVVVMRLPATELESFVPSICQGILLWAEDSKNKFRLKVRVILERISKRCGIAVLGKAVPEQHRALLTHIRKQQNRKERKKTLESEMDWDAEQGEEGDDTRSRKSRARTATKSAWNSEIFSDDDDDDGDGGMGGTIRTANGAGSARRGLGAMSTGSKGGARSAKSAPSQYHKNGKKGLKMLPESGDDPLDLLDAGSSRRVIGGGRLKKVKKDEDDITFETHKDGRMVIREEVPVLGSDKKRKRDGDAERAGFDSDDSDFEDLKGYSGLSLALKGAKSIAKASTYAASIGGRSTVKTAKSNGRGDQHSGSRFKSKKGGAGGDVKGTSKVEPYAYWPLDRKMLNRRAQKTREAKVGLDKVVAAAKAGAAKGRKSKRDRKD